MRRGVPHAKGLRALQSDLRLSTGRLTSKQVDQRTAWLVLRAYCNSSRTSPRAD